MVLAMHSRNTNGGGSLLRVLVVVGVLAIAAGLFLPGILQRIKAGSSGTLSWHGGRGGLAMGSSWSLKA